MEAVIHFTHEAGYKVGGIGAVLDNLLASPLYAAAVPRTVLVGPFNRQERGEDKRLLHPSNRLSVAYGPALGMDAAEGDLAARLAAVEADYGVAIVYGSRVYGAAVHEVLLIDAGEAASQPVNDFKFGVWQRYGIDSQRYEWLPEYELYMRHAPAALAALNALLGEPQGERVVIAHEWMGMPFVFAAQMAGGAAWKTVFYAHEMASARLLVENHGGHDTRFYNAMYLAQRDGLTLDAVFGDPTDYFKYPLIKQAVHCDKILAVGDLVVPELRFLGGAFGWKEIDLVYNGVPSAPVTLDEKRAGKALLQAYAQALVGIRPDFVFSHVARLIVSKGMWRDVRVLEHLDDMLASEGKRAVLFMVATSIPTGRHREDVYRWEYQYGWPAVHRSDNGDLQGAEIPLFYDAVEPFNRKARAVRIVLVNQYGWSRERCGLRMPAEMTFGDLRRGSDLEFGQSVYEPFGIAQVEPLNAGALCVVSGVCGCVGFVRRAAGGDLAGFDNLVLADYVTLPAGSAVQTAWDALAIDQARRDALEASRSREVALRIFRRLPWNEEASRALLAAGRRVAAGMSWDVVVRDYFLPAL